MFSKFHVVGEAQHLSDYDLGDQLLFPDFDFGENSPVPDSRISTALQFWFKRSFKRLWGPALGNNRVEILIRAQFLCGVRSIIILAQEKIHMKVGEQKVLIFERFPVLCRVCSVLTL